jgi:SAM-dependent methyltransferase
MKTSTVKTMNPAQLWQLGDYATVGERWAAAGQELVHRVVRPGDRVLDVACGSGAVALAAAAAGAEVTGLDIAPSLLAAAAERATAMGVAVRWVEADMTAMPEPDASYDRVLSAFGAMFAADPVAMAAELVRVCAVDGLIGVAAWTPDSPFGLLRPTMVAHLPAGTPGGPVTEAWGDPEQVPRFFEGQPVTVQTIESRVAVRWPSLDAAVDEITTLVPGAVGARTAIEPTGAWPAVCEEVRGLFSNVGYTEGDDFVLPVAFLITLLHRR